MSLKAIRLQILFRKAVPDNSDNVLARLRASLLASQSIVGASGLPFLSGVLQVGVQILDVIQQLQDEKTRCVQLAQRIVTLMTAVYQAASADPLTVSMVQDETSPLMSSISDLTEILLRIHAALRGLVGQKIRTRLWNMARIKAELDQYERDLALACDAFKMRLSISTAAIVRGLASPDGRLGTLDDVDAHQLSWPEVTLERSTFIKADRKSFWANTDHADVRGQIAIVKRYTPRDQHKFHRDVEWLKTYRHPNLLQLLGTSRTNATVPFIAVKLATFLPIDGYLRSLGDHDRGAPLLYAWNMLFDLHSAIHYLSQSWLPLGRRTLCNLIADAVVNSGRIILTPEDTASSASAEPLASATEINSTLAWRFKWMLQDHGPDALAPLAKCLLISSTREALFAAGPRNARSGRDIVCMLESSHRDEDVWITTPLSSPTQLGFSRNAIAHIDTYEGICAPKRVFRFPAAPLTICSYDPGNERLSDRVWRCTARAGQPQQTQNQALVLHFDVHLPEAAERALWEVTLRVAKEGGRTTVVMLDLRIRVASTLPLSCGTGTEEDPCYLFTHFSDTGDVVRVYWSRSPEPFPDHEAQDCSDERWPQAGSSSVFPAITTEKLPGAFGVGALNTPLE